MGKNTKQGYEEPGDTLTENTDTTKLVGSWDKDIKSKSIENRR